jgi:hypothetical protein
LLGARVILRVVSPRSECDSSINNRDVVDVLSMDVADELGQVSKSLLVIGEVSVAIKVVDIRPLGVKRDIVG